MDIACVLKMHAEKCGISFKNRIASAKLTDGNILEMAAKFIWNAKTTKKNCVKSNILPIFSSSQLESQSSLKKYILHRLLRTEE